MDMASKKVYIAGPAVFDADWGASYYNHVREVLKPHGVIPLIPTDSAASGALNIRKKNLLFIDECDAIIADLSPFRSLEPDCGTAFEVGYASAKGKTVITFTNDKRSMMEKYGGGKDADGRTVENFDLPFNLMLYDGVPTFGSFDEAFTYYLNSSTSRD